MFDDWEILQMDAQLVDNLYINLLERHFKIDISTLALPLDSNEMSVYPHPFSSFIFDLVTNALQIEVMNGFTAQLYAPNELITSFWFIFLLN